MSYCTKEQLQKQIKDSLSTTGALQAADKQSFPGSSGVTLPVKYLNIQMAQYMLTLYD